MKPVGLAGLVTDSSKTLQIITHGFRRHGSPDPIEAGDRWHIGSNAKAMTAMLYARLADQNRALWNATVEAMFPEIQIHESWRGTTVEQLMSHTGGLTDDGLLNTWQLIKSELDERPLPQQRLSLAAKAFSNPARGHRGRFQYANANYVVVGAAIEQRTGSSWEAAIDREIFQPLGMRTIGFGAPTGEQPFGHKSSLFPWKGMQPVPPGPAADNPAFMAPAGGVHIALEDYSKFLRLFLQKQDLFVSRGWREKLVARHSEGPAYALGWLVDEFPWAGGRVLTHDGSNTMWYATAVVGLESGLAAAAVSNEGSENAARATHALARELLEEATEK